ncbi:MAG: iron-containing alcohol dehydrogenase [Hyphomicrobiales bacterium]
MTTECDLSDPTDLAGLRRYLAAHDPESRLAPLAMVQVEISDGAHFRVLSAVQAALAAAGKPSPAKVVVLTDTTDITRRGALLRTLVNDQLTDDHAVKAVTLDDGHPTLHADDTTLDKAAAALSGADLVVTIGSGTMTDIGKVAAQRNGGIPHVAVQTAASVDGFTDNVSVVLRNGVKRTVPSAWPTVVLADVTTIGEAPRALNTSGFGEAISLFTAPADWYLANLTGLDTTFHPASMALLKAAAASPPDWSAGIAAGEATATKNLARLLALRGIVSGISNTTACLSGVEHVISHMLDLHHAAHHQPIGLHGAQVGVASLVASKLWRRAIAGGLIDVQRLQKPDMPKLEKKVRAAFAHLGTGGSIADECWGDCQRKWTLALANWDKLEGVARNWSQHSVEFAKMVQPAEVLRPALVASGSPATFGALSPAIAPSLARWAVANCHLMRNRFNLVDLLELMGLWTDDLIDWTLAETVGGAA